MYASSSTNTIPSSLLPSPSKRMKSIHPTDQNPTDQNQAVQDATLPNNRDLFKLANKAWRGIQTKEYKKHGVELFRGLDLVQWLLYQNGYPDTEMYREYVKKIAQAFIDNRYMMRVTSPPRMLGWIRKKRVNTTFSDDKYLFVFNDVAVSNIHVVVLIQNAKNLMGRDRNGHSDPVCQVSLGGRQISKTNVIYGKTSPVWNEVFTFGVKDLQSQQLIFNVAGRF